MHDDFLVASGFAGPDIWDGIYVEGDEGMENELADMMGAFALNLVSHRARRAMYYLKSWPQAMLQALKDPNLFKAIIEKFHRHVTV